MIVIADIHLGKVSDSIYQNGELSQTADIRKRLVFIMGQAVETGQCIVIAGDIFNKMNPTTQVLSEFFWWLSECSRKGVRVYLLAGNHDAGVDWTSMAMMSNVNLQGIWVVTSPDVVRIEECGKSESVLMWPHVPVTVQESAEAEHGSISQWVRSLAGDGIRCVVTHGMLDLDYSNDIFFEAGNAMRIDPTIFESLKLMVLGHIHNHTEGNLSNGRWIYPGSLIINNFGEVDEEKGWVSVDLESLKYTWHEFTDEVTPWVHVELDFTDKDESSLSDASIRDIATGAILKITVMSKAHGVINEALIRQMFNNYGHVSRFETVVMGSGDKSSSSKEVIKNVSHSSLLKDYLRALDASKECKTIAFDVGKKIMAEVLA